MPKIMRIQLVEDIDQSIQKKELIILENTKEVNTLIKIIQEIWPLITRMKIMHYKK